MYNVAPIFCPPSWLHECYSSEFSCRVKVVVGPTQWGTCTRTVSCPIPGPLAYWNNNIATSGPTRSHITILSTLTGSQTAILFGHKDFVTSLTYSSDGTFLVSGSYDQTVKLWDVQTGGVIKTLHGHTEIIWTVSISADHTMIASSGYDLTYLWNIRAGNYHIIRDGSCNFTFSPTNSQLLSSSSNDTVQQWDINGYKIGSPVPGSFLAFSPDGTQFVSWNKKAVIIRDTDFRRTIKKFNLDSEPSHCCFSPNGRLIAASVGYTIYIWDAAGPNPYLVQTFIEHSATVISLVFSSPYSLISASEDRTIKFWQIDTSPADPGALSTESTSLTLAPIKSVSLQARDGLAFSLDEAGVVKTWNILTGNCDKSYKTQIKGVQHTDIQLINDRVIVVWTDSSRKKIYVWDAKKGKLRHIATPYHGQELRVVGDGSRVLQLCADTISVFDIWTGKFVCEASLRKEGRFDAFRMDGSRVLVHFYDTIVQGWDFGTPGSTPTQFFEIPSDRSHLKFTDTRRWPGTTSARVEDSVTGKIVLQLCGKYADPSGIQWDGQYLIAGYNSGEVLILDFSDALAQ